MIDGLNVLAVIPARGGSKGLPRKNVLPLAGRPLIAWTIDVALASRFVDRTIVSTDDEEIAAAARLHGAEVPFMRPAELATDSATTPAAILHALQELPGYDIVVILQPTNPLRTVRDVDDALARMIAANAPGVVSVTEPLKSPYWSFRLDEKGHLQPLLGEENSRKRRQELPRAVTLNGVLWAVRTDHFVACGQLVDSDTVAYEMSHDRSLDIDSARDFRLAELIISEDANCEPAHLEVVP